MYVLKAMANVLKKISYFFGEVALVLLSLSLMACIAVSLVLGIGFVIEAVFLHKGFDWVKGRDWFFINIGIVEMILLPILLFGLSVRKEYKRLIQKDAEECFDACYKEVLLALIKGLMEMNNKKWKEKACENLSVEDLEKEVLKRKETCEKDVFYFLVGRACEQVLQMADDNEEGICKKEINRLCKFVGL